MRKNTIRAIFFDLDDTLFASTEFTRQAHFSAVQAMVRAGVKMSPEELFQELMEVIAEFSSNHLYHFDKLLLRLPPNVYNHINHAILIASAVVAYHDAKYGVLQPFPDAIVLLKKLSSMRMIRGIITSGLEVKQAEKLIRLKIYPYLTPNAIFISDQIGISKPNPKIYHYACNYFQIPPEQAIYIGDRPDDIDTPNQIGMITVRIVKGGKYDLLPSNTAPLYQIQTFDQLLPLLERDFELIGDDTESCQFC